MPSILNVNNYSNNNDRKLSSKLSFDVGEKFTGKIVNIDEKAKEVTVRLSDGWQFTAEISEDISRLSDLVAKFQVDGFQDGKLKLKLVRNDGEAKSQGDVFQDFLKSQGLSKDDVEILKEMLNHGMQASKEDIAKLKGILNFKEDLTQNPETANKFIDKYISSKQIDSSSPEAVNIRNTLSEFFDEFKTLTDKEVFLFLECDIDFNAENINAFKNITKKDGELFNSISQFKDELSQIEPKTIEMNEGLTNPTNESGNVEKNSGKNDNVQNKMIESSSENISRSGEVNLYSDKAVKARALTDIYNANKETKINMMGLLKAIAANDSDILKYVVSDVLLNDKMSMDKPTLSDKIQNKLVNLSDKEIILKLKQEAAATGSKVQDINKGNLQKALSDIFQADIKLNDKQAGKIENALKYLVDSKILEDKDEIDIKANSNNSNVSDKESLNNKNITSVNNGEGKFLNNEENLLPSKSSNVNDSTQAGKDTANLEKETQNEKQDVNNYESKPLNNEENLLINKSKVDNSDDRTVNNRENIDYNNKNIYDESSEKEIGNEKQYVNVGNENEISQSRGKADSTNDKNTINNTNNQEGKTLNNEESSPIAGNKTDKSDDRTLNNSNKNIHEENNKSNNINDSRQTTKDIGSLQKELGSEKQVNLQKASIIHSEITSQEIVKQAITDKSEEIKSIIKDVIKNIKTDNEQLTNKVFEMVKDKITEFKVYNSLSNEYYYMDIPVNLTQGDYPCKLIIKDNRKGGKKIDSTNLKLVVSVRTITIGVVDAYIGVKNKHLNIDMKCEGEFAKILSLGKQKLRKDLNVLGYSADISVSEKIKEATLSNCSEFFNDTTIAVLDTKV